MSRLRQPVCESQPNPNNVIRSILLLYSGNLPAEPGDSLLIPRLGKETKQRCPEPTLLRRTTDDRDLGMSNKPLFSIGTKEGVRSPSLVFLAPASLGAESLPRSAFMLLSVHYNSCTVNEFLGTPPSSIVVFHFRTSAPILVKKTHILLVDRNCIPCPSLPR